MKYLKNFICENLDDRHISNINEIEDLLMNVKDNDVKININFHSKQANDKFMYEIKFNRDIKIENFSIEKSLSKKLILDEIIKEIYESSLRIENYFNISYFKISPLIVKSGCFLYGEMQIIEK